MGNFSITYQSGQSYLFYGDERIAECVGGDHEHRYGGLQGWLKHIEKRTAKRLDKIQDQIDDLEREEQRLRMMDYHITQELRREFNEN